MLIVFLYFLSQYIFLLFYLFKILALVTLRDDLDAIIECIPPLVVDCACIIKMTNLVCNIQKVCKKSRYLMRNHICKEKRILSCRSRYCFYTYKGTGNRGPFKANLKYCTDLRRVEEALPLAMPVRN